jgi:hypothetical protein
MIDRIGKAHLCPSFLHISYCIEFLNILISGFSCRYSMRIVHTFSFILFMSMYCICMYVCTDTHTLLYMLYTSSWKKSGTQASWSLIEFHQIFIEADFSGKLAASCWLIRPFYPWPHPPPPTAKTPHPPATTSPPSHPFFTSFCA